MDEEVEDGADISGRVDVDPRAKAVGFETTLGRAELASLVRERDLPRGIWSVPAVEERQKLWLSLGDKVPW